MREWRQLPRGSGLWTSARCLSFADPKGSPYLMMLHGHEGHLALLPPPPQGPHHSSARAQGLAVAMEEEMARFQTEGSRGHDCDTSLGSGPSSATSWLHDSQQGMLPL